MLKGALRIVLRVLSAHEMSDAALSRANTHESALTELGEPLCL